MNQIHKSFEWDMGHRISSHGGKCYSVHGHRYRTVVWLNGILNNQGMVLDYYQLSQIVDPIVEELDHAFMVYDRDTIMTRFFNDCLCNSDIRPFKVKHVSFESTAENIAKYIFDEVRKQTCSVQKVEVWETPKCCAVYTVDMY